MSGRGRTTTGICAGPCSKRRADPRAEGEDAITLRRLARTLEVSHAAPGHHFRDRDALVAELAADGFRDLSDAITAAFEGAAATDWLRHGGKAYVRYGIEHPARYRLMFTSELLRSEDCPERLRAESSRAYGLLLKASYGDAQAAALAADPGPTGSPVANSRPGR